MVEKLRERGAADICVPRKQDYDPSTLLRAGLVHREAVLDLLHDARPDLIIHLAASVGGIGANLTHQAEVFYKTIHCEVDPTRYSFDAQYRGDRP